MVKLLEYIDEPNAKQKMLSLIFDFWSVHNLEVPTDEACLQDLLLWTSLNHKLYFIIYNDLQVGFIHLGSRGEQIDWLEEIFVLPEYQNLGIGTKAIQLVEEIVSKYSASLYIEAAARNQKAIKLYHKIGYDCLNTITVRKDFHPDIIIGSTVSANPGQPQENNLMSQMENMIHEENQVRLLYTVPSRGLIGFMTEFMTMTKGYGMMSHTFKEYRKMAGNRIGERKLGVLVSMENGQATAYALGQLEDRGVMFIEPGTEVYEGMIVGEHSHDNDLAVNVVKGKKLTNTRASGSDHTVVLKRPRALTLEYCLDYINSDELVEVTPENFRMRKRILNTNERKKYDARKN